jgi:peptide subunit release factor 1 (eRF1)
METAAELQAIGSALTDIKQEALSHVAGAAASVDREKVQQETRDTFLQEVLKVLEEALSPSCYASARGALVEEFGEE